MIIVFHSLSLLLLLEAVVWRLIRLSSLRFEKFTPFVTNTVCGTVIEGYRTPSTVVSYAIVQVAINDWLIPYARAFSRLWTNKNDEVKTCERPKGPSCRPPCVETPVLYCNKALNTVVMNTGTWYEYKNVSG